MNGSEGKTVLFHAMKAYRRSRGIAPLICNFGTMCVIKIDWVDVPGLIWLGVGTSGVPLWGKEINVGFHRIRGIY
jgi:hypothetical protein